MKKCKCADVKVQKKNDINISLCDVNVKKNRIDIVITREPDTPLIAELRRQIAELQQIGLDFQEIDRKIADAMSGFDIATKAYLAEVLTSYAQQGDLNNLKLELKEWANSRFMRKMFLSQEAFDALEAKEENVMYCII